MNIHVKFFIGSRDFDISGHLQTPISQLELEGRAMRFLWHFIKKGSMSNICENHRNRSGS